MNKPMHRFMADGFYPKRRRKNPDSLSLAALGFFVVVLSALFANGLTLYESRLARQMVQAEHDRVSALEQTISDERFELSKKQRWAERQIIFLAAENRNLRDDMRHDWWMQQVVDALLWWFTGYYGYGEPA